MPATTTKKATAKPVAKKATKPVAKKSTKRALSERTPLRHQCIVDGGTTFGFTRLVQRGKIVGYVCNKHRGDLTDAQAKLVVEVTEAQAKKEAGIPFVEGQKASRSAATKAKNAKPAPKKRAPAKRTTKKAAPKAA